MKPIFSATDVKCCIPTDVVAPANTTNDECCTGLFNPVTSRCALKDYTDVSVYLNRFVSSEGRSIPDSSIDPETGYIKNTSTVLSMATEICASGRARTGIAIANLPIPNAGGGNVSNSGGIPRTRRPVYRDTFEIENDEDLSDWYDAGVRWNNHVYCVPATP